MPRKFWQGIGESTDCIFFTRGRILRPRYGVTWQFNEDVPFIVLSSEFVLLTYRTDQEDVSPSYFKVRQYNENFIGFHQMIMDWLERTISAEF